MASLLTTSVLLSSLLLAPSLAQFVPPANLTKTKGFLDIPVRYKEVPEGICELTPGVKSYSGYIDTADDRHLFFWFFEARNQNPKDAPLTLWLGGGPGTPSMLGLFQEIGPCGVDYNGNVYNNPYAANNVTNLLFIDEPAQTGFSYSTAVPAYLDNSDEDTTYIMQLPNNTCPDYAQAYGTCGTYSYPNLTATDNSTDSAAPTLWRALQGFLGAFPQYSAHGFHFTTESYGGHYGPVYSTYIQQQNAAIKAGKLPGASAIDLRTLQIGNGWYDPLVHMEAYYNFTVWPGNTYDLRPFNASIEAQLYNAIWGPGNCQTMELACNDPALGTAEVCAQTDDYCETEVEGVLNTYADRDDYDMRERLDDPFPYEFYVAYLNRPHVLAALGAAVNYTEDSPAVDVTFDETGDDARELHTVEDVAALVAQGVYVIQYNGDADYICNWLGGEVIAERVGAKGFSSAGYTNISTEDGVVHGQVKQSGNYAFARIYLAGHEVPFYQPLTWLTMLNRSIHGVDIETGKQKLTAGYLTKGTAKSTYREGNGTVQYQDLPKSATYNITTGAPNPIPKHPHQLSERSETRRNVGPKKSRSRMLGPSLAKRRAKQAKARQYRAFV